MIPSGLRLEIFPERYAIRSDIPSEFDILVSLSAQIPDELQDDVGAMQRPGINFCIALDRNGSMAGPKLDAAKQTCIDISERLAENDGLLIVAFDDQAHVVAAPDCSREEAAEKIRSITPGGMTNLSLGWYTAILEIQGYSRPDRLNRVILLSDGRANTGETKLYTLRQESIRARQLGITTSTIGVGIDFEESTLETLAHESGGRFWFIRDNRIQNILGEEIRSALMTRVDRPRVKLLLPDGVSIGKELNSLRKNSDTYRLRPIQNRESLTFAVRLCIEPARISADRIHLEVTLFNGNRRVTNSGLDIPLQSWSQALNAKSNALVGREVQKFFSSTGDEKLSVITESQELNAAMETLAEQIGMMSIVRGKLMGDKTATWESHLETISAEEREERLRHEERLSQELDEIVAEIAENENLMVVTNLLKLAEDFGSGGLGKDLILRWRKIMRHRHHKKKGQRLRLNVDDEMQIDILQNAREIAMELCRRYSENEMAVRLRDEIDERLGRYSS